MNMTETHQRFRCLLLAPANIRGGQQTHKYTPTITQSFRGLIGDFSFLREKQSLSIGIMFLVMALSEKTQKASEGNWESIGLLGGSWRIIRRRK
jgi:hypothetical protein